MKNYSRIFFTTLIAVLLSGCGKNGQDAAAQKPVPLVQVLPAKSGNLTKFITYTGSIEPIKMARMASPAEGPIVECSVREGDLVKKGQILVKVGRSRIAETGLEAAREELRRQESEFKRVEQLVKSGSLPGEQIDAARSNLRRAEAQVAATETGADDYEIQAPWDGLVSKVWISEGNYVAPRVPLVDLYDPASLVVRITIPEQQALAVHEEQPVQVSLDAYPDRRFTGKITRVYPELERSTRTLTAEAVLIEKAHLLSGMFARVDIAVQTLENAVIVPESALTVMPNGEVIVFVITEDNAARRKVKTALEAGGTVAIESGIRAGEMVVIRGSEMLKDGSKVQVAGQKKKEPPASQTESKKDAKP